MRCTKLFPGLTPEREIQDLIRKAREWREWESRQITGENDEFLLEEYQRHLEEWGLLKRIWQLTADDNEYLHHADKVWDQVIILEAEINKAGKRWRRWLRKIKKIL